MKIWNYIKKHWDLEKLHSQDFNHSHRQLLSFCRREGNACPNIPKLHIARFVAAQYLCWVLLFLYCSLIFFSLSHQRINITFHTGTYELHNKSAIHIWRMASLVLGEIFYSRSLMARTGIICSSTLDFFLYLPICFHCPGVWDVW